MTTVSTINEIPYVFGVNSRKMTPSKESTIGSESSPDVEGWSRQISFESRYSSTPEDEECGEIRDSDSDTDENQYYSQRNSHHGDEDFLFRSGDARSMSDDDLFTERVAYNQYDDYGANFVLQAALDDESIDDEQKPADRIPFDGPCSKNSYRFSAPVPLSKCSDIVYGDMSDDELSSERIAHNEFSFANMYR